MYRSGSQLRAWEWNALIDYAGQGFRRIRVDDFRAAMAIYHDMVANRAPGASLTDMDLGSPDDDTPPRTQPVEPDIVTYTTLLSNARRTRRQHLIQEAEELLHSSGLTPNHVTLSTYLPHYATRGDLSQKLDIAAVNACLWAYARNGRLSVAALIYRILRNPMLARHGLLPADAQPQEDIQELEDFEGITIPADLEADAITYYSLVQAYAYHGHLRPCLSVFRDMMSSPERSRGEDDGPLVPNPALPLFRAIFLGFARHGQAPDHGHIALALAQRGERPIKSAWMLEPLSALFDEFLAIPAQPDADGRDMVCPNSRIVYWLLSAFAVTSGADRALLRDVWARLTARFGARKWDGRVQRFRDKIYAEEMDAEFFARYSPFWFIAFVVVKVCDKPFYGQSPFSW
ncbi:uncharacterized protein BXZ73DRAFT_97411 [Epithele typhae]|uniref:uncharacterized protein n=1 Tax=Epithele typhae TaxID=378194 RepID=UPI002008C234|nr:uncharacterized protein BXZ73DRAFT_97411 [Epithele typhae]KAH9943369.1 hypothetical protein BXZ73DRAFT_97411 [Epithele typhae]